MAISDLCAVVTVPKPEYETLIRSNERMKMLENVLRNRFTTVDDIRALFGIKGEGEKCESL